MNSGGPSPRLEIGEVRSGGAGGWFSLFVFYLIIFCVALVCALFVLFQDTIPVLSVREVYASIELGGGSYSFISYVHNVHFHHLHWLLLAALVLSCVVVSFKVGAELNMGGFAHMSWDMAPFWFLSSCISTLGLRFLRTGFRIPYCCCSHL